MKKFVSIVFTILILTSCKNRNQKDKHSPTATKAIHQVEKDTSSIAKMQFKPDTTIGKISLLSTIDANHYLGKSTEDRLKNNLRPHISVVSNDASQRLVVYFNNDNTNQEFSEFSIQYNTQENQHDKTVTDSIFQTESGIRLGMTMHQVKSIKGKPVSQRNGKTTLLYYEISDFDNSEFLKKHDLPIYYTNYKFKDNHLISFSFGFEYSEPRRPLLRP